MISKTILVLHRMNFQETNKKETQHEFRDRLSFPGEQSVCIRFIVEKLIYKRLSDWDS